MVDTMVDLTNFGQKTWASQLREKPMNKPLCG